jgi:transcriptional regulator with XRE-family HTH domain
MTDARHQDTDHGPDIVRLVGAQIKTLRLNAGLNREQFGTLMGYSEHTISSIEQGRRRPAEPDFLDKADEILDARGLLILAKKEVAKSRLAPFFRDAANIEEQVIEYHCYENQVVPGLLQTEAYARALYRMRRPTLDEETIEEQVAARLARQDIFDHNPAPTMSFVLEEAVLHRPYGGREILRGEREHLLTVGQRRNVEIQIMPTDAEDHAGAGGPITLLRPQGEPMVAYVEVQNVSALHQDTEAVREMSQRYEIIRAQALTPRESMRYIETLLGDS